MDLDTSTALSRAADRWRSMRHAKRVDRLDGENDRLPELRLVKSQLEHEREHEQGVLEALNRVSEPKTEVTPKSRGGLLRMILVGGAALIFGTKAGRERYERIRARMASLKHRVMVAPDDVDTSSPGLGPKPNPLTESGIRPRRYEGSFDGGTRRSA